MHGYNVQEALFPVQALGRGQYGQILIKSLEIPFFSPKYIIDYEMLKTREIHGSWVRGSVP